MKKTTVGIISGVIVFVIICFVGYYFFLGSGSSKNVKAEHQKYIDVINITHDFDTGVAGLESLQDKSSLSNIKTEIKIAKELKNTHNSLDNKDIEGAKKSLEKVETLKSDDTFSQAEEWLKSDITNYDKALKEIEALDNKDSSSINAILDKYKFNHSALKAKLSDEANKNENKENTEKVTPAKNQNTTSENKPVKMERKNSMGMTIPDNVTSLQQEWIKRGGDSEMLSTVKSSYKNAKRITTNYNSLQQANPDDPLTIYIEMKNGETKTAEFNYQWISGAFGGYVIHVYDDNLFISVN
ncbi:hypothetical protein HMPREF1983_00169 [Gemella bergeri ATCC 700627]|uniref:Uncharacterized protein n=1 Tax=Gemella bergeri ATCC 700627 TaxID=1321820 RepID=U2SCG9_9BACL|nr:hypothetical protein [Gemella bergeri]ERK60422.1 hypothetical protein HMPREF1983_00169 [Gemella bergeri ATCC 700627]